MTHTIEATLYIMGPAIIETLRQPELKYITKEFSLTSKSSVND